jgi:hypothetical protein
MRQGGGVEQGLFLDALLLREATGNRASRELAMAVTPNNNSQFVLIVVVEDVVEDDVRGLRLLGSPTIAPGTAVYISPIFAMVIILNACCSCHIVTNNMTVVKLPFLGTELTGAVQGMKRSVHRGLHESVVCFGAVLCFRKEGDNKMLAAKVTVP